MSDTTIPDEVAGRDPRRPGQGQRARRARFPGDSPARQPVHIVYGGAHLFTADAAQKLGAVALRTLEEHAPDAATLAAALGLDPALADAHLPARRREADARAGRGLPHRLRGRLRQPARRAKRTSTPGRPPRGGGAALKAGTLPPFIGIRIKPLSEELKRRSLRTLDLFLTTLLDADRRHAAAELRRHAAEDHGARAGDGAGVGVRRLRVLARHRRPALQVRDDDRDDAVDLRGRRQRRAAAPRRRGRRAHRRRALRDLRLHRGLRHHRRAPAHAAPGVRLREERDAGGARRHRRLALRRRDQRHAGRIARRQSTARGGSTPTHVRHSLVTGFYQGWDLHPAQLPSRYAAVYAFFLEGLDAASERLNNFVQKAAQATLVGDVFDDAATGQGLLNYFLRAMNCGAIDRGGSGRESGLTLEELRSRSFVKILASRRAGLEGGQGR